MAAAVGDVEQKRFFDFEAFVDDVDDVDAATFLNTLFVHLTVASPLGPSPLMLADVFNKVFDVDVEVVPQFTAGRDTAVGVSPEGSGRGRGLRRGPQRQADDITCVRRPTNWSCCLLVQIIVHELYVKRKG